MAAQPWFEKAKYIGAKTMCPRPSTDWDTYFMDVAKLTANMSKCVGAKNGAVIVRDKKILATGFNGSPPGSSLCQTDRFCPRRAEGMRNGVGREFCPAIHSEVNAILNAPSDIRGATMYVWAPIGICKDCAAHIVTKGISRIVKLKTPVYDKLALLFFEEAGMVVDYMSEEYHAANGADYMVEG